MRILNTPPGELGFWIRSVHTDLMLALLRQRHGDAQAFDLLYRSRPDPWSAETYRHGDQSRKYDALLRCLPQRPYRRVLDVGCGLALRADSVLGVDLSHVATQQTQQLPSGHPNVSHRQGDLLTLDPDLYGEFDLIVMARTRCTTYSPCRTTFWTLWRSALPG